MLEVPIFLENKQCFNKLNEVFEIGVPFPKGSFNLGRSLVLNNKKTNEEIPFSYEISAYWSDKSVKWAKIDFRLTLESSESVELFLGISSTRINKSNDTYISVENISDEIIVDTGDAKFHIGTKEYSPFSQVSVGKSVCLDSYSKIRCTLDNGEVYIPKVTQFLDQSKVICRGAESKKLLFSGEMVGSGAQSGLNFLSTIQFFSNSAFVKLAFTIWNPAAAIHPGGCWDLGDEGSVFFKELVVDIKEPRDANLYWKELASSTWESTVESLKIIQSGSGGKASNDNSSNGLNNALPIRKNGYRVCLSGKDIREGYRASPQIHYQGQSGSGAKGFSITLEKFWQNFPKAFHREQDLFQVQLFPMMDDEPDYELQAGERKTHSMCFDFHSEKGELDWVNEPSGSTVSSSWYAKCQVFPFMGPQVKNDPLASLVVQGIDGESSFHQKRETIDEYGWRDFGEVYADHEALYQNKHESPLVSHYNNQYDAIYGYARQFVQTGDSRWFALMDELAKHVVDIDIYHTKNDRVEYNGGLFWHTDHYLDAHTCTHRTFSALNNSSSTPGQTGGGPGSEHCYTTGLMYHYYLTGDQNSKDAVVSLSNWMISSHDGAKSFLAQILSLKKYELGQLLQIVKRADPLPYRYPFTRGTGNFIVSLLDAFSVTGETFRLRRVEEIIQNTMHPSDDISRRNLDDIEVTWSYVVFLQSVAKYLFVKEGLGEIDYAYKYARASLLHYTEWMLENESAYLSRTEILEFPNDTWVAQEIRKLSLFIFAARYDKVLREQYRNRATEFLNVITGGLSESVEKHFSRIQILLLQSYGPHLWCDKGSLDFDIECDEIENIIFPDFGPAPVASIYTLTQKILKKLFFGLKHISISGEKEWLRTRT